MGNENCKYCDTYQTNKIRCHGCDKKICKNCVKYYSSKSYCTKCHLWINNCEVRPKTTYLTSNYTSIYDLSV